jgi:hypothetical protein
MRLLRLTLRNVRGVEDRTLVFTDDGATTGVVVVEGPNEAGKSTLGDALDVLLTYKDRSTHADVRSLKTVDRDEPPEVEVELEVGEHRLTYFKRFVKRPATELTITAPRRESLQGDEAHDRVLAILEASLDVGLWRSLRLRQGQGLEQAGPGGTSGLATALAGHGDASAIGDRELAILERVREEYTRYFTDKGAPKKPLREAQARVDDLTDHLAAIDQRRESLQGDVATADRLVRDLPELREQVVQAETRAKEHADALAEVRALTDDVAERERAEEAAGMRLAHLRERHQARQRLVADLAGVEEERAGLAQQLADAEQGQRVATERWEAARARLTEAQERQRRARVARQAAQLDLDHLHDHGALQALEARAGQVADARDRLREAEAEAAGIAIDDELLDTLRTAHADLTRAQMALDAASPQVRFTAARPVTVTADGHAADLDAGATGDWTVHGTLALQVGDVGTLEVEAGAGTDDAAEAHRTATTRLRDLLEHAATADLAAAEAAHRRRRDALQTAGQARRERDTALAGMSAEELEAEVDRLRRQVDAARQARETTTPLPADTGAARAALEQATEQERQADTALAEPEEAVELARAELDRQRELGIEQRTRADGVDRRVTSLREELDAARQQVTDAALAGDLEAAQQEHAAALVDLDEARRTLADADPDVVISLAENAEQVAEDARARAAEAEQQLRETRVRIAALGGDGLWEQREELATELTHAQAALEGLQRRAAAARTLYETLERHRAQARERYAAPLRTQLLAYGRMLFGSEFDVELDEDLKVARRYLDGAWLEVGALSIGAREQLALLGRLACATLLGDQGGLLLFDDALGNSDPERLEALGAVLRLAGEHSQVVVLTCYPDRYRHVGGATRIRL